MSERYLEIVSKYSENILFFAGAHIHSGDIRAPTTDKYPNLEMPIIVNPSFSPKYSNNPGYGLLEFDDDLLRIDSYKWIFMNLWIYVKTQIFEYHTVDLQLTYNIDLNNGTTINNFVDIMKDSLDDYGPFVLSKFGMLNFLFTDDFASKFPIKKLYDNFEAFDTYMCAMKYYN